MKNNSNESANVKESSACTSMKVGECKYIIKTYFSQKATETVTKKLERLIVNEALKHN